MTTPTVHHGADSLTRVLALLRGVRRSGDGYVAVCPAHDDHDPSLSISLSKDGDVLLNCHAKCKTTDVVAALGLTMSDLFQPTSTDRQPQIIAKYDYVDENGTLLYQSVRGKPKRFRQRRPDGMDGWIWNLRDTRRVLYRLSDLINAPPESFIYVVEGEKDADRLAKAGMVATTSPMGAGKWASVDDSVLEGRHVVILGDADGPGRSHAQDVAGKLHGRAASVRVVDLWPDRDDGADVSDWFDADHDSADLDRLATDQIEWSPPENSIRPPIESGLGRNEFLPEPVVASELGGADETVEWIWEGYLAHGHVTLFSGLWKAGKSTLIAHLLSRLDADGDFLGCVAATRVLIVSEESEGIWRHRCDAIGIGDHVSFVCRPFAHKLDRRGWEGMLRDIAVIVDREGIGLVVFDTFPAFAPMRDENEAAGMMEVLLPLNAVTRTGAGVMLIHHLRKGDATEGQGSRGSGALTGFVDIIVEFRRYDGARVDDSRRILTTLSRFEHDPEVVIDFDPDHGYTALGSKHSATQAGWSENIERVLADATDPLTFEELLDAWPDGSIPPGKSSFRTCLRTGLESGRWRRSGAGVKGDPHRYFVSSKATPLSGRNESVPNTDAGEDAA